MGTGPPTTTTEVGRVSVTETGRVDAHRTVQPRTGRGPAAAPASRGCGDAGVPRDHLPSPLRARPRLVAAGSRDRVTVRTRTMPPAETGWPQSGAVPGHGDDLPPAGRDRRPRRSQCPGMARSVTSAGRSLIRIMSGIFPDGPLVVDRLGRRMARPVRRCWCRSARRCPRPCTYRAW